MIESAPNAGSNRSGPKNLNISRWYGRRDVWTPTAGFRELVQNLWDGVMETYDLAPDDIIVQETTPEKRGAFSFKIQRVDCLDTDRNTPGRGLLAEIKWRPQDKLQLINYGVRLSRDILGLGDTTKRDRMGRAKHLIGGHGEGLKIGKETNILRTGPFLSLS